MDSEAFERLERFNAQVDIWIDQEEYGQVEGAVKCSQDFQTQLKKAFSHPHCTRDLDDEWLRLLRDEAIPLTEVGTDGEFHTCFDQKKELDRAWSRLFWAKLVRAKIQEKGSDCYFQRLDEVISYLERYLPVVKRDMTLNNTIAIIYLLEMAAAGEGADQRSFSERARKVLKTHFKQREQEPIHDFYDLLARYNMGVGYQHEGMHRKAVREFNWIIEKIKRDISSGSQNSKSTVPSLSDLLKTRFGEGLLYLPAVLKRAGIQLKLQLAYHASKTLRDHWNPEKIAYLDAWRDLLLAEAFREMGELDKSEQAIARVVAFCKTREFQNDEYTTDPVMDWQQVIMGLDASLIQKKANLFGRLVDLMTGWCLERFNMDGEGHITDPGGWHFSKLLQVYWQSAMHQTPDRHGFLEQVAECLALLVARTTHSDKAIDEARKIYNTYKKHLLNKTDIEEGATEPIDCPCSNTGIDLRRLGSEHFDNFVHKMETFFEEIGSEYSQDKEDLWKRLFYVEKEHREDLACRKRKLILARESLKEPPEDWCEKCVKQLRQGKAFKGFGGLLQCSPRGETKENEDEWLTDEMYEHIMDHWDDHFVDHLRHPSFHEPRCRGLHFVGLQRWNSASPAQGRSVGGGYFIYHTDGDGRIDLGVAVDPGFDFLRNLFHCGFSLRDIDVVLLSHAHVDHVRDFESMVALCLELKKRKKIKHKLQAIMTLGVYRRSAHVIQSPGLREFVEPYILDIEKEIDRKFVEPYFEDMPNNNSMGSSDKERGPSFRFVATRNGSPKTVSRVRPLTKDTGFDGRGLHLTITATRAYHEDYSDYSDSFGFKIRVTDYDSGPIIDRTIGYTGDTAWHTNIVDPYKDCDALIVHLGSLVDRTGKKQFSDYDKNGKQCWALVKKKNHPYLTGMLHFLTDMAARSWHDSDARPLVLVSEFGEELRGRIRVDLYRRLKGAYGCLPGEQDDEYVRLNFLPVDVGLDVLLAGPNSSTVENGSDSSIQECKQIVTGPPPSVWCAVCQRYVSLDKVDFKTFGHDEALFSVCQTCQRSTPFDVLQDRLRALYEVGTPLKAH